MFRAECHGWRIGDCHGQEPTSRCHSSAHSKGRKYGQNVGREGTLPYCHSHCHKSVVEKLQQVVLPQPMCLTQAAPHGPSIGPSDGRDRAQKAKSMPRSQSQMGGHTQMLDARWTVQPMKLGRNTTCPKGMAQVSLEHGMGLVNLMLVSPPKRWYNGKEAALSTVNQIQSPALYWVPRALPGVSPEPSQCGPPNQKQSTPSLKPN